ncbi:hypothetical protein [Legionella clemsonensis]|uniref:Uncharacterized protein n=1 Tax=Legionella clemsonensis TaxID=1867846 RepID=A0A222NZM1_9GAMM|nr:hypothetical protein [Legionella clemsonensis]ASQ45040.1 hypothetical protein clem_02390 [Legionella clemsonensis]
MPTIQELIHAKNKTTYLLKQEISSAFYSQLSNLDKEERIRLAKEIVNQRGQNFPTLIRKLSKICFDTNGAKFIREGSADFLAGILAELVKQNERKKEKNKQFVPLFIQNEEDAFPEDYQFDEEVAYIFSTIYEVAGDGYDETFANNLASNLANKIFNGLILESPENKSPQLAIRIAKKTQQAVSNAKSLTSYFRERIDEAPPFPDTYYQERQQSYQQAVNQIKDSIITAEWEVGKLEIGNFAFFRGGVDIEVDGKLKRVPHRVAEIYKLITTFEAKADPNEQEIYQLYHDIQQFAQEALNSPRRGQKQSTKDFYGKILNDFYLEHSEELQVEEGEEDALIMK